MSADQRLKGQEISLRVIQDGVQIDEVSAFSNFNDEVSLELKEDGYLGEFTNRFDEIMNGFGGDTEIHVNKAAWENVVTAIVDRAQRKTPATVFNVVRSDFFPNGDSIVYTYSDVHFGAIPTSVASRADYVKVKFTFKCEQRPTKINAFL